MRIRNVVAVIPFATDVNLRFARALARCSGVRLFGVFSTFPEKAEDRALFQGAVRTEDAFEQQHIIDAVELLRRKYGAPDHIVGTLESIMLPLAHARERFDVPAGTRLDVADVFRDKAKMKDRLRAAGVPVAKHRVLRSIADGHAFAADVGLPLVLKPLAGVGSVATSRIHTPAELTRVLGTLRVSTDAPVLAEEMLTGAEHTYETITLGGTPRVGSFSRYLPSCLDALENPWIQWAVLLPREVDTPLYTEAARIGRDAIRALGLDRGMTHMEFFERLGGGLVVGEIAQRPPGPQLCQMTGLVHDVDIYEAWARLELDGVFEQTWERKYAAGAAFLRSSGHGRVAGVTGLGKARAAIGSALVEARLPRLGRPRNDSYEGDGYIVVRHESTEKVREMLDAIVNNVRVRYA